MKAVKAAWPHIKSVIHQIWIPTLLATIYGTYDWYSSGKPFVLSVFLKVVLPALFFIMWFVALFERAKKRNTDKDSFDKIGKDVASLTSLVGDLKSSIAATHHAATTPTSGTQFSQELMVEASDLAKSGHSFAALLQAGVAFDHAIRSFARHNDLAYMENRPLLDILRKASSILPAGWEGELHTLRRIRNSLAHATKTELQDIGDTQSILNAYRSAIDALEGSRTAA